MPDPTPPLASGGFVPGQPIQIQLPPTLVAMAEQWPGLLARVTALEAAPVLPVTLPRGAPSWLVALAAFAWGLVTMLAGQWAWGHWGV